MFLFFTFAISFTFYFPPILPLSTTRRSTCFDEENWLSDMSSNKLQELYVKDSARGASRHEEHVLASPPPLSAESSNKFDFSR